MLQIIIFSFNRALQLDTLIDSLMENWKEPMFHIDILYNTSNEKFQQGYNHLIKKCSSYNNIKFHNECSIPDRWNIYELSNIRNIIRLFKHGNKFKPKSNFRSLLIKIMENNMAEHVMFMTDDTMFIRKVEIGKDILNWIYEEPKKRQYSLRCGSNMNEFNSNKVLSQKNILHWNFYECNKKSNWGYPFSVDAHIYSKEIIIKLFRKYIFCNPNTLEGVINTQVYRKKLLGEGKSSYKAYLLSYPINIVQTVAKNENMEIDCEMLNNMYLDGYTLRYPIPEIITDFQQYPKELFFHKDGIVVIKKLSQE